MELRQKRDIQPADTQCEGRRHDKAGKRGHQTDVARRYRRRQRPRERGKDSGRIQRLSRPDASIFRRPTDDQRPRVYRRLIHGIVHPRMHHSERSDEMDAADSDIAVNSLVMGS